MAMASDKVTADVIEATEFPEMSERYSVMSVPKIVINDTVEFTGALPEPKFMAAIAQALQKEKPQA